MHDPTGESAFVESFAHGLHCPCRTSSTYLPNARTWYATNCGEPLRYSGLTHRRARTEFDPLLSLC
jgi:hypothetical protein